MFSLKFSTHFHRFRRLSCKKSLKTPKKQPEAGSRRKTHNTMTKRKKTKGQTNYTENKISSNTNSTTNWGWTRVLSTTNWGWTRVLSTTNWGWTRVLRKESIYTTRVLCLYPTSLTPIVYVP